MAHDRGHAVAGGPQSFDNGTVAIQHLRQFIGDQAATGADVAGVELDGVKRWLGQRRQVRVTEMRIAEDAVVGALATVKIGIDAAFRIGVERAYRGHQLVARHADLPGQRLQRRRLEEIAVLEELARQGQRRWRQAQQVRLPVGAVKDDPARHVRHVRAVVQLVDAVHDVRVRRRLVHEALALAVHHHRAGRRAFGDAEVRIALTADLADRPPPGVFHQVHTRTSRLPGTDAVAGVAFDRDRPGGLRRLRVVLIAHGLVMGKAARGQQHAAPGPIAAWLEIAHHFHPDHAAVFLDQPRQGGVQFHRYAGAQHRVIQTPRNALPHRQHGLAGQQVAGRVDDGPQQLASAAPVPAQAAHDLHPAQADRGVAHAQHHRPAQVLEVRSKFAAVEGQRLQRPAIGEAARRLRVIVRIAPAPLELHRAVVAQEGDHVRAMFQVGLLQCLGRALADRGGHVGAGQCLAVRQATVQRKVVVRNPHAAAGSRGAAADVGGFFDDHAAQAVVMRGQRRGHAPAAAADHDPVELLIPLSSVSVAVIRHRPPLPCDAN